MAAVFLKDPDSTLDYKWDWATSTNQSLGTDWLEAGETISSGTVTAASGLTVSSYATSDASTSMVAWLSGGTDGEEYMVTCRITTSAGRIDERSILIKAKNR